MKAQLEVFSCGRIDGRTGSKGWWFMRRGAVDDRKHQILGRSVLNNSFSLVHCYTVNLFSTVDSFEINHLKTA